MLRGTKAGFNFDEDNNPIVHSSRLQRALWAAPEGESKARYETGTIREASPYLRTHEGAC